MEKDGMSFSEFLRERAEELEEEKLRQRPDMMGKAVAMYRDDGSKYPERIRVSFADGHTEVYDLAVKQPAPQIVENIKIIRRWKVGYEYHPPRRRRR